MTNKQKWIAELAQMDYYPLLNVASALCIPRWEIPANKDKSVLLAYISRVGVA